jgi:hypothetical protein
MFITVLDGCLEFLKLYKVGLNQICKRYKRNKKTEKEKGERRNKNRKRAPWMIFGPVMKQVHGPS